MHDTRNVWFVVCGDESDLRSNGRIGPRGDVEGAIRFARAMVPVKRVLPVFLEQNRPWWDRALRDVPEDNVLEQPLDRGSAPGILGAAVRALCRDPDAILVLLCIEGSMPRRSQIFRAVELARREDSVVFVPRTNTGSGEAAQVVPVADLAPGEVRLEDAATVTVARARALLDLFRAACPDLVQELGKPEVLQGPSTLDLVFPFLPETDFLTHVLMPAPPQQLRYLLT